MARSIAPIPVAPVAYVCAGRETPTDDHWDAERSTIELATGIPAESLQGLDAFSHVEIVFVFDRVAEGDVVWGARHPRGNVQWPQVGIFAQRAKARPNRIGVTMCRLLAVHGTRLQVAGLDAVVGTPVLDIKPVMREFLPREAVRQPAWSTQLMEHYW